MRITPLLIQNEAQARRKMASLGVSGEGARILAAKSVPLAFEIEGIGSWEANIIKQQLLSLGSDAALRRDVLVKKVKTSVFIFGSISQIRKFCEKLKYQPFQLPEISRLITTQLNNIFKDTFTLCARDKRLPIKRSIICGIINLTPDSFSGDGLVGKEKHVKSRLEDLALIQAQAMVKAGAKMLDLGGESSRPFSQPVKSQTEIKRVIPVLKAIRKKFPKTVISVDTYKYPTVKAAIDAGADVINDIMALRTDLRSGALVAKYKLGCVLMHMRGNPQTMQVKPRYHDAPKDIIDFFSERIKFAQAQGIKPEQILLDPGIGFGKRYEDNLKIINELDKFKIFGLPIFLGLSRKSFIGKALGGKTSDRLIGTLAASAIALVKGAKILRVHDVGATQQAIKVVDEIMNN